MHDLSFKDRNFFRLENLVTHAKELRNPSHQTQYVICQLYQGNTNRPKNQTHFLLDIRL